jgi:hypothetical protein
MTSLVIALVVACAAVGVYLRVRELRGYWKGRAARYGGDLTNVWRRHRRR